MLSRQSLTEGLQQGCLLGIAVLALVLPVRDGGSVTQLPPPAAAVAVASPPGLVRRLEFGTERRASSEVVQLARWVVATADNGARPFVVLDKKGALVFVFAPSGRLLGATPVLLGSAIGDDSVEGIGERPLADVRPEERTTPAGRFEAERGRNLTGEEVLWVDYEAAVSMHRVRLNNPAERRLERLASPRVGERRISYGCVNLPAAFFDRVLWPTMAPQGGAVYVLPELKPLPQVFPQLSPVAFTGRHAVTDQT